MKATLATTAAFLITGSLGVAQVFAQDPAPEIGPSTGTEDAAGARATGGQLSEAQAIITRGERLSTRVAAMKTQAEREQDIIRVTCLNGKLAEVNANLRNAKSRLDRLRTATPDRVPSLLTIFYVLGQKFDLLDQEANQCIGQQLFDTGTTKVETEIDTVVVPTEQEAQPSTVPDVVPPAAIGEVVVEAPPTPQEASPNGDES